MPYATGSTGLALTVRGSSRRIMIMVPTREYQTDQSSLKPARLLLALSSRKDENNCKDNHTEFAALTRSLHIRPMHSFTGFRRVVRRPFANCVIRRLRNDQKAQKVVKET